MIRLQEIMTSPVMTISPDETLEEAFKLLMSKNIHHLIVLENDRMVGVISAFDLASIKVQERGLLQVKERMSRNVISVTPETSLKEAAETMQKHHFECLPVCRDGELLGIVTVSDLLNAFCRGQDEDISKELELGEGDWCSLDNQPPRWRIHPY